MSTIVHMRRRVNWVCCLILTSIFTQMFSPAAYADTPFKLVENNITLSVRTPSYIISLENMTAIPRFKSLTPEICNARPNVNIVKLTASGTCRILLYYSTDFLNAYSPPIDDTSSQNELIINIVGRFNWSTESDAKNKMDVDGYPLDIPVPGRTCSASGTTAALYGVKLVCNKINEELFWQRLDKSSTKIRPTGYTCKALGLNLKILDENFKCIKSGSAKKWDSGDLGTITTSNLFTDVFTDFQPLATTLDVVIDHRDNKPVDKNLLRFLDDLNNTIAYIDNTPTATKEEISGWYTNVWSSLWEKNYGLAAEDFQVVERGTPTRSSAILIQNMKSKRYFCAIDTRWLGMRYNQRYAEYQKEHPDFFQLVLYQGSCDKLNGLSKV